MKKGLRWIALMLAVVLFVGMAASCASSGTAVLEYGSSKVTANMYSYWLSRYKAIYLYTFSDMTDSDAFWTTQMADGVTAETYLGAIALQSIMSTLISMEMFDNLGLKLSDTDIASVDAYIENLITELGSGSRSQFNQVASAYGVNDKILKEIYIAEEKASQLYDYFYGENGTEQITDVHRDAFYQANYAKIQHLYINNAYETVLDEDGNPVYDENGDRSLQALTGDALAAKNESIAAVDAGLENGEDFETLWETYSEDKLYENGYYLTSTTSFITEVVTAALTMEEGAVQKIETTYGTHYVKKYPLDDKAYTNEANADFFSSMDTYVCQALFNQKISGAMTDVVVHEAELNKYSIRTATPNYSF